MAHRKLTLPQVRKVLRQIPFNNLLGMKLLALHSDGLTIECAIGPRLLNKARVLHGGVTAALVDAAVGIALHRHLGDGRAITTVELKINYFRPAKKGKVFARAHLLRIGSTLCVGRVDITDAKARAIGAALVTYMILSRAEPGSSSQG
jgi:uncharacterized protein (TIGR00369 family)